MSSGEGPGGSTAREAGSRGAGDSLRVAGIVLGAGGSRRFGTPKQLLPFAGTTLLGQAVANANASALDEVVVVLGRAAGEVRRGVDFGRASVVENPAYARGCSASLAAGLAALSTDCEALALLPGDQPGIRPAEIDHVVAAWRRDRPWAAVTSWRGTPGHPFLFARPAFPELEDLQGDKAIWALLERHPNQVLHIPLDADLPPDVDNPEDYQRALEHWRRVASAR